MRRETAGSGQLRHPHDLAALRIAEVPLLELHRGFTGSISIARAPKPHSRTRFLDLPASLNNDEP
jgi:hypothetical protein